MVIPQRECGARERWAEQQVIAGEAPLDVEQQPCPRLQRLPHRLRAACRGLLDQAHEAGRDLVTMLQGVRRRRREHRQPQLPLDPPRILQGEVDLLHLMTERGQRT